MGINDAPDGYRSDYLHYGLSYPPERAFTQGAANVIAAPFWSTIEKKDPEEQERLTYLRNTFSGLLVTGPFSLLFGFSGGIMALNRPFEAPEHGRPEKRRHGLYCKRGIGDPGYCAGPG